MVELADIVRSAGERYRAQHGDRLLPSHRRVLRDLVCCRTAALGGQLYECACGARRAVYHSCRNRHCPKCQGGDAEDWLDRRRELLLPTTYGLATCTLPEELRAFTRSHQRVVYSILMREAAHALLEVGRDRRFIGGMLAIMAVLHTWTRAMLYHPHVHLLFPVGGLSVDGSTWRKPRKGLFILPSYALAKVFRERVEAAFKRHGIHHLVPERVWRKRWVANVKRVGNGDKALLYLSRYVFRIAMSNDRIEGFDGHRVTFRWIDSGTGKTNRQTLPAQRFIGRFLQHVLPRGFVKVRYYGLWAQTCRHRLEAARTILQQHLTAIGARPKPIDGADRAHHHEIRCPACGAVYTKPAATIPRPRPPP